MELINLNEPAFPIDINTTQLWEVYCEKVRRINTAKEMLQNEQMCLVERINRAILALGNPKECYAVNMKLYGYRDDTIPLVDYCRMFNLSYNTILGRVYNKHMTPWESILLSHQKERKRLVKRGRTDAELRKQRAHLERIIERLAADAAQQEQKYIG